MKKEVILLIIRFIIGIVFLFSGITKLVYVEPFELSFAQLGFSWNLTPFIARLFIAFEFVLGLCVIFRIKNKLTLKSIIGLLIIFTFYLAYLWYKTNNEADCGCFGEYLKMNPLQSIIKNIVLGILAVYLLIKTEEYKHKMEKVILSIIIISSLISAFAFNYIDFNRFKLADVDERNYRLELELFDPFIYGNDTLKMDEGKKIVCFFSLRCPHCKLAAQKISIIKDNLPTDIPVYYYLGGDSTKINDWWKEANSHKFPYNNVPDTKENARNFWGISGGSLPAIFFIENGIVWKKVEYSSLNQEDFELFLGVN